MIASISGTIQAKGDRFVILENGGVGYRVFVTPAVLAEAKRGGQLTLFTYHHVAENANDLFGFPTTKEVAFYELLQTISSIGPKTALAVMSVATLDELASAIQHGDPTLLTKVSGVGRKTAERIVLELKEKVDTLAVEETTEAIRDDAAVLDALVALGYTRHEARAALRRIPRTIHGVSERVRESLKQLSGHGRPPGE